MTVFESSGALNPQEHRSIIIERVELGEILSHIKNQDEYAVIQAPSQSGKTTLLYQIHSHLHQHGYGVVYLDLSPLADLEPSQFYQMFCAEILNGLDGLIVEDPDNALTPDTVINQISFFKYLRLVSEKTQQIRKLVFMVDELSSLSEALTSPLFSTLRSFFTRGRGISSDRDFYKKVMFIFAGDLDLDKLIQGRNSPLRNICKTFTLDDLSKKQVLELAQNLKDFPPEIVEFIADSVHQWSDGHPYVTQRLFALIDEKQEYRKINKDIIPESLQQLVREQILFGNDANLAHVFHYLRNSDDSYLQAVCQILRNSREKQSEKAPHAGELILMGIIKRSSSLCLVIRNKVYEEALKNFFEHESRTEGKK